MNKTWNTVDLEEYGPWMDDDNIVVAQCSNQNYFVWYPAMYLDDLKASLKHMGIQSSLYFEVTNIPPKASWQKRCYYACFDYVNGDRLARRYVHIFNSRAEARELRKQHPDIVLPPVKVWIDDHNPKKVR